MRIIDSHLHLWDPKSFEYAWLEDEPDLHRAFDLEDLDTEGNEVVGVVVVEAGRRDDQALAEARWVHNLTADWPQIRAMIAHAPTELGTAVRSRLDEFSAYPLVKGIRRNLQNEPSGFASSGEFIAGVECLAEPGYTFDVCVRHWQLPEAAELVSRVPSVTFVLDHLGKPPIAEGRLDPWRENLTRLAQYPNVFCKLSGLTTEADPKCWRTEDLLPYLHHALAEFGAERCLVGGDWPVASPAASYGRWLEVVGQAIAGLSDTEQKAVLADTATRVYRLPTP